MSTTHTFMTGINNHETKTISPTRACRWKCLECCNFNSNEVRDCHIQDCALWPFRFGKDPGRKKVVMSEERREKLAEQLKNNPPKTPAAKGHIGANGATGPAETQGVFGYASGQPKLTQQEKENATCRQLKNW